MLIKITNPICFVTGHNWLPKEAGYAICRRCHEIRTNVRGVATTLAQVVEGMKR